MKSYMIQIDPLWKFKFQKFIMQYYIGNISPKIFEFLWFLFTGQFWAVSQAGSESVLLRDCEFAEFRKFLTRNELLLSEIRGPRPIWPKIFTNFQNYMHLIMVLDSWCGSGSVGFGPCIPLYTHPIKIQPVAGFDWNSRKIKKIPEITKSFFVNTNRNLIKRFFHI